MTRPRPPHRHLPVRSGLAPSRGAPPRGHVAPSPADARGRARSGRGRPSTRGRPAKPGDGVVSHANHLLRVGRPVRVERSPALLYSSACSPSSRLRSADRPPTAIMVSALRVQERGSSSSPGALRPTDHVSEHRGDGYRWDAATRRCGDGGSPDAIKGGFRLQGLHASTSVKGSTSLYVRSTSYFRSIVPPPCTPLGFWSPDGGSGKSSEGGRGCLPRERAGRSGS